MFHLTATIRDRGQVTIPDKIRELLGWAKPNMVVSIRVNSQKELLIRPFELHTSETNWEDIWRRIKRARTIKGKNSNLSKFITQDRERH